MSGMEYNRYVPIWKAGTRNANELVGKVDCDNLSPHLPALSHGFCFRDERFRFEEVGFPHMIEDEPVADH